MNSRSLLTASVLALLCASAAASGATRAAGTVDSPSLTLRYTDAQLHNPEGARRLYSRLRSTADAVCASEDGASLERRKRFEACRKSAVDRAVAAFDAPLLTALHDGNARASVAWAAR